MKELKILHVDTQMSWRGGERQALELIRRLNGQGVVNILACKPDSEISKKAEDAGIRVVHLPLKGEWDIYSALNLRSFIRHENIDIAHAHTSHAHGIAFLALAKLGSCKLVVSRRVDFHIKSYLSRKFKYGSSVDKIISVSDAIKRVLIEDGIDEQKIVTIRSGFVLEDSLKKNMKRDIRKELGLKDDAIVVATVAAFAPHKAHYVLLKSAYHVLKKYPETVFLLAGDGELRLSIENDIKSLGIEQSVHILGFVDDIGSVYESADIFALSSKEEGLCTSLLDAMYYNLPIVATSAGGIPEIVRDSVNGYIVPVADYTSFAERLGSLIGNSEHRKKMGARSASILESHTIEHTVEKTLEVYREVAGA
ncbi:glycosyltransferase [Candidatus Latescibacterota bacterium]